MSVFKLALLLANVFVCSILNTSISYANPEQKYIGTKACLLCKLGCVKDCKEVCADDLHALQECLGECMPTCTMCKHNFCQSKVKVCHKDCDTPPVKGKSEQCHEKTLTISVHALAAHLKHGDAQGACDAKGGVASGGASGGTGDTGGTGGTGGSGSSSSGSNTSGGSSGGDISSSSGSTGGSSNSSSSGVSSSGGYTSSSTSSGGSTSSSSSNGGSTSSTSSSGGTTSSSSSSSSSGGVADAGVTIDSSTPRDSSSPPVSGDAIIPPPKEKDSGNQRITKPCDCDNDDDGDLAVIGGGGCSLSGGAMLNAGILLLLAFMFWQRRTKGARLLASFLVALILLMFAVDAKAQTPLHVNNFKAAPTYNDYYTTYDPTTLKHLQWSLRALYDYSYRPLELLNRTKNIRLRPVLRERHNLQVMAALGVKDKLELGLVMPFVLDQKSGDLTALNYPATESLGSSVGDLRIVPKLNFVNYKKFHFGVVVPITVPTGDENQMSGSGKVSGGPSLLGAFHFDRVRVAVNIGYRWGPSRKLWPSGNPNKQVVDLTWDLLASAALRVELVRDRLDLTTDLFGSIAPQSSTPGAENLEWLSGLRGRLWKGLFAEAGFGVGLSRGVGVPRLRVLAGLGYQFGWKGRPVVKKNPLRVYVHRTKVVKVKVPCLVQKQCPVAKMQIRNSQLVIPYLYFATDKDYVIPQSRPILNQVAAILHKQKKHVAEIRIDGHADYRGSSSYNYDLAMRRAAHVRDQLIKRGIDCLDKYKIVSSGEDIPYTDGKDLDSLAQNRRVIIRLILTN